MASRRMIAGGAWTAVKANGSNVGLALNASYDEDWNVQPAIVLNHLGPIDYDSQGYSCMVTIGTFFPQTPGNFEDRNTDDQGTVDFVAALPLRSQVQRHDFKGNETPTLSFVNTSNEVTIAAFERVILARNGARIRPDSHVTADMQLFAYQRTGPEPDGTSVDAIFPEVSGGSGSTGGRGRGDPRLFGNPR